MCEHRLRDLKSHFEDGIESGHRFLKDHRNSGPADLTHLMIRELEKISAIQKNTSSDDSSRRTNQSSDGHCRDAFATTTFAYYAQGFPLLEVEGDVIYCLDDTFICEEVGSEILNLKNVRQTDKLS